jgi:predicted N-formylglutamate amidohydrolase
MKESFMADAQGTRHWTVVITCEHAGNKVPAAFLKHMSRSQQKDLNTHKGWDPGALAMARQAAKTLEAPLLFTQISRLLVDCNRSPYHANCLGPAFRDMDAEEKNFILAAYYWPHRNAIEKEILKSIQDGSSVLHLAMHSFTPVLNGNRRTADGLSTWLRKHYGPNEYAGIEVEWNQALFTHDLTDAKMKRGLARCLQNLFLQYS